MSKRKLTRKQAWRINKIQEERTARANKKNAAIDAHEDDGSLGPEQAGLVIAHYGTQVEIEGIRIEPNQNNSDDTTPHTEQRYQKRCHLRANLGSLAVSYTHLTLPTTPYV